MIITMLTGSLALRKYKTGVHVVHENILARFAEANYLGMDAKIACYCTQKDMENEYPEYVEEKYSNKIVFSHKITRVLMYFLPVELFFGKADLYFCDGIIPHTLIHSKKIALIHDLMVKIYPENYSLFKRIYLEIYYHFCKNADLVIAVSETTKKDIIKYLHIEPDKIKVVYNGIDKKGKDKTIDASNMNIDFKQKYLLYIGDMRKNKNLIFALKAFEEVHKRDLNLKFYIAGAKKFEYENLKNYVELHGLSEYVIFLGYVSNDEKVALYQNAHALVFISEYEGFGIPILEAALYNLPVITSDLSSMQEIGDGYVITVDPHNVMNIAKEIERVSDTEFKNSIVEKQKSLIDI